MRKNAAKFVLPVVLGFVTVAVTSWPARHDATMLAETPPMGWNSWDSWGLTINEKEFRDTTTWFQYHLQRYGWQYVIVDEGWYLQHPENPTGQQDYTLGRNGRYQPAVDRFPSSADGKGFRPLADWVHSQGLKFGIHIIRGIPREAVAQNLPIAHSHYRAADAADTSDTCSWNSDNYGVKNNKAGRAYYDSLADMYARWGVDFLKVDCISSPWKGDQIRMVREALNRSGRPIVLSLSPGPTPLAVAQQATEEAQMWRISDDVWDLWSKPADAPHFPQAVKNQFGLLAQWESYAGPGHWPDADMLPIGTLGPRPGWGKARRSRLSHDEVRTLMTLWSIARSPLVIGANLLQMDAFTESMITNPEIIAVDQYSENNRPVIQKGGVVVWMASVPQRGGDYVAIFNTGDTPRSVNYAWHDLGIQFGRFMVRDLWQRQDLGRSDHIATTLPAHGAALYRVSTP